MMTFNYILNKIKNPDDIKDYPIGNLRYSNLGNLLTALS